MKKILIFCCCICLLATAAMAAKPKAPLAKSKTAKLVKPAIKSTPLAATPTASPTIISTPAPTPEPTPKPVNYQTLLTVSDVEKISGLKAVRTAPQDMRKLTKGLMNFMRADGHLILMVDYEKMSKKEYQLFRSSPRFRSLYAQYLKGIGQSAFEGPKFGDRCILSFYQGISWITLTTCYDSEVRELVLTSEQLKKLAIIALSRMQ